MDEKHPRTRDPNTTTEEKNRGRSMKLELMNTPIVMKLVLSQLFCRYHLIGNDYLPSTGVMLILRQLRYPMFR